MFDDNAGFDLNSLNLSGVQAAAGSSVLPPGRYVCKVRSCKLADTKAKDGSKMIEVLLSEINGKGVITARINIHNVKSAEATRIGREQLKALAVHSGAPDPDAPFATGINALNDSQVGVVVGSEQYQGEARSRVNGFCDPKTVKGYEGQQGGSIGGTGDDDIPF